MSPWLAFLQPAGSKGHLQRISDVKGPSIQRARTRCSLDGTIHNVLALTESFTMCWQGRDSLLALAVQTLFYPIVQLMRDLLCILGFLP